MTLVGKELTKTNLDGSETLSHLYVSEAVVILSMLLPWQLLQHQSFLEMDSDHSDLYVEGGELSL